MAQIILADRQGSGRKGGKNGQMEKYDGPPKDLGSWGDLPRTCAFVEARDPRNKGKTAGYKKAVIDYLGRSAKWPWGCYKGSAPNSEPVYMTAYEVIDLAREMGMTAEEAGDEWRNISTTAVAAGEAEAGPSSPKGSEDSSGGPPPAKSPSPSTSRPRTGRRTAGSGGRETGPDAGTASTGERPGSPASPSTPGNRATKPRSRSRKQGRR